MSIIKQHADNTTTSDDFPLLRIPLVPSDAETHSNANESQPPIVPQSLLEAFQEDGFVVLKDVVSTDAVAVLNDHLEDVLRGIYDRGIPPDKTPKVIKGQKPGNQNYVHPNDNNFNHTSSIHDTTSTTTTTTTTSKYNRSNNTKRQSSSSIGPIGFSGNLQNVKVLQIINIHKADSLFRTLETNRQLGSIVAQLAGWEAGARLAQDQVWAKPPGAPPLVFHRDSPYFMFDPDDVVTVWFALDDMDEELGPLEYVRGSHKWGDGRVGSAQQFFQPNVTRLLRSAAEREGIDPETLEFVSMAGLAKGSLSIHNGRIWHGSAKNSSKTRSRRGLGMHFVPANVRFTSEASHSRLWKSYVAHTNDPSSVELSHDDFPITSL